MSKQAIHDAVQYLNEIYPPVLSKTELKSLTAERRRNLKAALSVDTAAGLADLSASGGAIMSEAYAAIAAAKAACKLQCQQLLNSAYTATRVNKAAYLVSVEQARAAMDTQLKWSVAQLEARSVERTDDLYSKARERVATLESTLEFGFDLEDEYWDQYSFDTLVKLTIDTPNTGGIQ
ncbi:MAG: hypothetical protein DRP93_08885 [Candidatus Neomarinimicrobiota bacterium]|nr:MAG: hypothetical protein DRP93_08885 [Candidatus Neomarinimicrobiota bacterium]